MANSWRRERWDSLRLLTPNWQTHLPGHRYDGPDPDGYMTAGEVADFISRFAAVSQAPVRTNTAVTSVTRDRHGVSRGDQPGRDRLPLRRHRQRRVRSQRAVRAGSDAGGPRTGHAVRLSPPRPSARGRRAGRRVRHRGAAGRWNPAIRRPRHLSVGEHVRLPRTYRGRDVLWWMDRSACGTSATTRSTT